MAKINRPVVSATKLTKSYDGFRVLHDVNFSIQAGEKIGLVGRNGAGKSTLLKLLTGDILPSEGRITPHASIGYVPQELREASKLSVAEYINQNSEARFEAIKPEALALFAKLGLSDALIDRRIGELSGGEKTKVALVRILLADQDFLLLDEPTNNLDLPALLFLEKYIRASKKTFLIVSHDREFLDRLVGRIFDIEGGTLKIYQGNFSDYLAARTAEVERQWALYAVTSERERVLKRSMEEKVEWTTILETKRARNRTANSKEHEKPVAATLRDAEGAMGRRSRLIKDRLARFQKEEAVEKPREELPLHVTFDVEERSGEKVLELKRVVKQLPQHMLGPVDLTVRYGSRVLIVGENGAGKTTLLNIILDKMPLESGEVSLGSRVRIGYMPQEEDLRPEATVREEFLRQVDIDEGLGRSTLNRFRLAADDMGKRIEDLSSGERSRLRLAILMAQKPNCIVLDEPSNHLDLEVLESLEEALQDFSGTLIVVTHDRYFIHKIGFDVIYLLQDGIISELPSYERYEEKLTIEP